MDIFLKVSNIVIRTLIFRFKVRESWLKFQITNCLIVLYNVRFIFSVCFMVLIFSR